ncbi:hypothetical protein RND81_04G211700 [Saponaria officinalis]|uniref:Beta-galactosidase n=1 Tax=Saponaria officinalis TaxID=3572 RepID=A0AAW1LPN0_SAPOF
MEGKSMKILEIIILIIMVNIGIITSIGNGEEVKYDGRSLIIGGQRKLLFSGSIHYPRSTPQMWPSLIAKAKEGALDVIQTYVFWNLHEPQQGQYDFSGRNDLVKFIKEIQAQGLFVCLRIGPYIESEWNYGGLPFWLHDIPGISYRTDNEPFKMYMQNFTTKIVNMMKSENLYASQGGPIILSQIENEYQNVEAAFGNKGRSYVQWAAKMAVAQQTGVPWIMCKQTDAPDPVINTCNGMKCGETFTGPNSPNKPSMWTENWTSFYQVFGGHPYIRSAEDIAFHTSLFIAKNGSFVNYYMYHGGTNFGRTSAAYMITGYYDQAPLDEYGLLRQPKWGHLLDMHMAIKACEKTLLAGQSSVVSLGQLQTAYVFQEESEGCAAFLLNNDTRNMATVVFQNRSYQLPPKSISILPDCVNVTFNTATVTTESSIRTATPNIKLSLPENWETYHDILPTFSDASFKADALLEHMNVTKDKSDYLWYTVSFQPKPSCIQPTIRVLSHAHAAHAFVNGIYAGGAHGNHDVKNFTLETPIKLDSGINNISILSVMVGLPDSGAFLEKRFAGLRSVLIRCNNGEEVYNLSAGYTWGYKVGLTGEDLQIYKDENVDKVVWGGLETSPPQPLTWFLTSFDAPDGDDPVVLDLSTMSKGEAWINGQSIGRYWVSLLTSRGTPSQTLYHIPRSFLKPTENLLVMLEEIGGNPLGITVDTISTTSRKTRKRNIGNNHTRDVHNIMTPQRIQV